MSNFFNINFSDLGFEKQEELIDTLAKYEYDDMREEGQVLMTTLKSKAYKTWQECICGEYSIDWELADTDWDKWDYSVMEEAKRRAEERCYRAFKNLEV